MIRIIVRTDDAGMAAHVGGAVNTTFKTLDVELPELEAMLTEFDPHDRQCYTTVQVIGVEAVK